MVVEAVEEDPFALAMFLEGTIQFAFSTWTIEIGIYNTVLILTSLGSAVSSMSVPAAVCL